MMMIGGNPTVSFVSLINTLNHFLTEVECLHAVWRVYYNSDWRDRMNDGRHGVLFFVENRIKKTV